MYEHQAIIAGPKDIDDLRVFEANVFEHQPDHFSRRSLTHLATAATSRTLILRDEDGKIYAVIIGLLRHFKIPSGRVYKIGVRPDMKKRGVGSFLIKAIEEWFVESGMKRACAEIRESNIASRTMFARAGYIETGIRYWYYAGGENAVKCWKELCES